MKNKRFWFSCWTVTCISAVTVMQNISAGNYQVMILAVVAGFLGAQSYTDAKKVNNGITNN